MKPVIRALRPFGTACAAVLACAAALAAQSTNHYIIDATSTHAPIESGVFHLGTARSPAGHTIEANNRYLLRDGKPWLPVMAEFHFARYPAQYWEEEIEKMRAGGVQIVATYIFWIHHEESEGQFDWSAQRDLRRFVELCAKHGMLVYARIGPWSHGEARNGGFPDWLVQKVGKNLRSNDSTYLSYVARFYDQIGQQLKGLYWKDGGPVIGIQLENEYNGQGPLRGAAHILALKRLARASGMDTPLYSVTGWDNAIASTPLGEVLPVFGGYPDWPWDQSIQALPPNEVYAFRFENRWAGGMSAQSSSSQQELARYPFLGAEYAGGIEDTYHRRPVIAPNDIAAMLPVQLGSGVNLYGYYMFHGGTNPLGKLTTLNESQRTGYPTDVPVKSYDFQAPLGEFGEMRESFRKIKLVHYFLNQFGDLLAPMAVRAPNLVPQGLADTSVLRLSARTLGKRGFLFVSNYVRDHVMPDRYGVQITIQLPGETLRVPSQPILIPSGAYFIWPLNLDLNGETLKYATSQLMARSMSGDTAVYYFFTIPGIPAEFVFANAGRRSFSKPGTLNLRGRNAAPIRIVLLSEHEAENTWFVNVRGKLQRVVSDQDVFSDGERIHVRARRADQAVTLAPRLIRAADSVPPVPMYNAVTWRKVEIALAPSDSAFAHAALYQLTIPADALNGRSDAFLELNYEGDVARLYAGNELLDDNFFNGTPWRIGLKRWADQLKRGPLTVQILPLRKDAPIFLQPGYWPKNFGAKGQVAQLKAARLIPEYDTPISAATDLHQPARDLGILFHDVQLAGLFPDSKTFADAQPRGPPSDILAQYLENRARPDFDLKTFVSEHFILPTDVAISFHTDTTQNLSEHIRALWPVLTRSPDQSAPWSSLIPLPAPYVVPGGRFREVYYWDSYFTMLGLIESERLDLVRGMLDNFASLIERFGRIPNGNRTYYLSRSQPPYFGAMVALYAAAADTAAALRYLPALETEHAFWMEGANALPRGSGHRRVVKLADGTVLNRYWDDVPEPRPESYREDYRLAERVPAAQRATLYRNIKATAESGWDFSSRWLRNPSDLRTLETTSLIPVDLNSLLYFTEQTIAALRRFRGDAGDSEVARQFEDAAAQRKSALLRLAYDSASGWFYDVRWRTRERVTDRPALAAVAPLYFGLSTPAQARAVAARLARDFLKPGGFATTRIATGQQWDAPNGWAPLQWLAIAGLRHYGLNELADTASQRWLALNERVYRATGKLLEKYDVVDANRMAGGGEYPTQDGFGWTNGVDLALSAGGQPTTTTSRLRVMTYNIQSGHGNIEGTAEEIRAEAPDIAALQEVDVHWAERSNFIDEAQELARQTHMHVCFAPIYHLPGADGAPAREFGVALLSRDSIVVCRNDTLTRLSTQEMNAVPAPAPGLLDAIVDVHGRHVHVFNTHLDYRHDPRVRQQQVGEMLQIIGTPAEATLVFGDLNASPNAPEIAPLLARLHDAWPAAAAPGFTYPADDPRERIDYVLLSPQFRVRDARVPETQASDHRPVVVDLIW